MNCRFHPHVSQEKQRNPLRWLPNPQVCPQRQYFSDNLSMLSCVRQVSSCNFRRAITTKMGCLDSDSSIWVLVTLPSLSFVLGASFHSFTGMTVSHSWRALHSVSRNFLLVPQSVHNGLLFSSLVWHFHFSSLGGLPPTSTQKSLYAISLQHVDLMKSTGRRFNVCSHI